MAYQHILKYGAGYAWLVGSFGAAFATVYPHTFGLRQYRDLIASRSHGKPDEVDTEILLLAETIKKDLKWRDLPMLAGNSLNFIQTSNYEFCCRGSTNTVWGGLVGVPILFSTNALRMAQENPQDLLKYNIDLKTEDGKRLFDTFKLSAAARKFALAREMCQLKSGQLYVNALGLAFTGVGCYALSVTLSQQFRFRGARVFSFLIVVPTLALAYLKASDAYSCFSEAQVDRKAASISWDVANGGVEYYTALINRRQALADARKMLINNDGIVAATDQSWRKPELSLIERRSRLQEVIEKQSAESLSN